MYHVFDKISLLDLGGVPCFRTLIAERLLNLGFHYEDARDTVKTKIHLFGSSLGENDSFLFEGRANNILHSKLPFG